MKRQAKNTILILLIVWFSFCGSLFSQETDTTSFKKILKMSLSEILNIETVTSSKTLRSASDITQKVDVVIEQQINQIISGNRNISELIQYKPGASVKVLSRNDANWGAYGGIGPKYSTYMVQGLPIDGFIDPMSIDKMAIKRIEIQRGPASVLYPNYLSQDFAGNQSPLAGTVNLILKDLIKKPQTVVSAGYGSYNTYSGRGYHENHFGSLNIFGGISLEKSDYTNYGSENSWLNMLKNPEYLKIKAFIGTNFYIDKAEKHKITLYANQTIHKGNKGRINREYDYQYSLVNCSYKAQLADYLNLTLKTGIRWYDRMWQGDTYDTVSLSYFHSETSGVEQMIIPSDLSLTFNHFNNSNFTIGADYQNASYLTWIQPVSMNKEAGNDASASQMGIYLQEELQLNEFTIRAGGRFNIINYDIEKVRGELPGSKNQSWKVLLWSAGIKYRLNKKLSIYSNVGNSFMSPSLKSIGGTLPLSEMYMPGHNGQLPNPDLEPESGISADLGFDWKLRSNIYCSFRAFNTVITNAIIDNVISQNPSQTMSVNEDGKTIGQGFELSFEQQIKEKLVWFVNTTYTNSQIIDPNNPDQDGVEVPFVPKIINNAGITLYLPYDIELSPWLHYSSRIYDNSSKANRNSFDSGVLINLFVSKIFKIKENKKLSIFVQIYNLTNNKFEMPWQFRDPGPNINFGTRINF